MPLSQRYFLTDAVFVAGLASDDVQLLGEIREALRQPRYPLYLGRRAFPPAGPIPTELVDADLRAALSETPWLKPKSHRGASPASVDLLIDAEPDGLVDFSMEDDPISFDPRRRRYGWRDVQILKVTPPGLEPQSSPQSTNTGFTPPAHDPMLLVSDEEV